VLDRAIAPGRPALRRSAALALVHEVTDVDPDVVAAIDAKALLTPALSIAVPLAFVVGTRLPAERLLAISAELAAKLNRRILLLVFIWVACIERGDLVGPLAALLPTEHPALAWLEAGPVAQAEDDLVADLGEPVVCAEVLRWLNPSKQNS
jgi:hypothetical protein